MLWGLATTKRTSPRDTKQCPKGTASSSWCKRQIAAPPSCCFCFRFMLAAGARNDESCRRRRSLGTLSPVNADFVLRSLRDPLPPGLNDSVCYLSAKGRGSLPFFSWIVQSLSSDETYFRPMREIIWFYLATSALT